MLVPNLWHEEESQEVSNDRDHLRGLRPNDGCHPGLVVGVVALHRQLPGSLVRQEEHGGLDQGGGLGARVEDLVAQLDARQQDLVGVDLVHSVFHDQSDAQSLCV